MASFVHAREAFNRMPRRVLSRVTHLQPLFSLSLSLSLFASVTFVSRIGKAKGRKHGDGGVDQVIFDYSRWLRCDRGGNATRRTISLESTGARNVV